MASSSFPPPPPLPPEWSSHPEIIPMPPEQPEPPPQSWWRRMMGSMGIVGVLLLKFGAQAKLFLAPILKFFPIILKSGGSMIFTVAAYSLIWGWKYALGFVLLIFVHELGHVYAAKRFGVPVSAPMFIPFMGAFIAMQEAPKSAYVEAEIGIAGPIWGTAAAALCHAAGIAWNVPLLLALAWSGYFLNLFNLVPLGMLDGGRVVQALSPWMQLLGFGLMIYFAVYYPSFIVFLILAMSLPRLIQLFYTRTAEEHAYFDLTPWQRVRVGLTYFGLIAVLAWQMHEVNLALEPYRQGDGGIGG